MSEPRKPGRPPLRDDDSTTPVTVRVPSREYARACSLARRDRISLPAVIRRGLTHELDDADEE